MSSWAQLLRWCAFIVFLSIVGLAVYHSTRPKQDEPCQDTSELRGTAEGILKCHPKAKLTVHWGGAIPSGYVLDVLL